MNSCSISTDEIKVAVFGFGLSCTDHMISGDQGQKTKVRFKLDIAYMISEKSAFIGKSKVKIPMIKLRRKGLSKIK